jgi:hypothetical protein
VEVVGYILLSPLDLHYYRKLANIFRSLLILAAFLPSFIGSYIVEHNHKIYGVFGAIFGSVLHVFIAGNLYFTFEISILWILGWLKGGEGTWVHFFVIYGAIGAVVGIFNWIVSDLKEKIH